MKALPVATALLAMLISSPFIQAADDSGLQRLATCQDSWLDWKNDEARMARFVNVVDRQLAEGSEPGGFVPKAPTQVLGYPVSQVFPQSVGMGVGFSLVVDAPFTQVRQTLEKQIGRPLKCITSEGTTACEQTLGNRKNLVLMASADPAGKSALLGCYYYYEK